MALYVQLKDKKGGDVWHVVESFLNLEAGESSLWSTRFYTCGCGLEQEGPASQMAEADVPPWTNRHVSKGCFKTAADSPGKD